MNSYSNILKSCIFPNRKSYIDGLRGLAMIVVVYGHSLLRNSDTDYSVYFVFSNPLNVALFFTITGYLFSIKNGDQIKFYKQIFLRLVVPWLVLGLFPYVNFFHSFPRLISGKTLWFMPAIIVAEIIYFYIIKFAKNDKFIVSFGLLVSLCGMFLYSIGWLNYAMVNRAMTIQWLFVLGFIIRKKEDYILKLVKKRIIHIVILFGALGVTFVMCYPGEHYDIHYNRYFFLPLTWSVIILGILIVFTIFKYMNHVSNWLVLVGQNTLIIYLFHGRIVYLIKEFLPFSVLQTKPYYPVYAILETIIACVICLVIGVLANRYFPEIVGQKRRKI